MSDSKLAARSIHGRLPNNEYKKGDNTLKLAGTKKMKNDTATIIIVHRQYRSRLPYYYLNKSIYDSFSFFIISILPYAYYT